MVDSTVGVCLSFVNLMAWGSWPSIRARCKCEGPVFMPLHLIGQFSTAFFLSCAIDGGNTFSALSKLTPSWGIVSLLAAGFFVVNADFLCSCAISHLPGSIAFPIYTGFCMVFGMIMTYFVEGAAGSAALLFGGVATALCAVICLAMADSAGSHEKGNADSDSIELGQIVPGPGASRPATSTLAKPDNAHYFTLDEVATPDEQYPATGCDDLGSDSPALKQSPLPSPAPQQHHQQRPGGKAGILARVNPWIYVCMLAGALCSTWSPLSNIGRLLEGGVTHPYAALLFFETGQLIGLPITLAASSLLARRSAAAGGGEKDHINTTPWTYLRRTYALPRVDKAWGVLAGAVIGLGYTMYFTASGHSTGGGEGGEEEGGGGLGATIALGIASCEPLAAIFLGVTLDGVLRNAPPMRGWLMGAAAAMFVAAISLMVASA